MIPVSEADLKKVFRMFDTNEDGKIDLDELKEAWTRVVGQPPSGDELEEAMAAADIDQNGFLDLAEYLIMMKRYMETQVEHLTRKVDNVFDEFDMDEDGFITKTELKEVLQKCGHFIDDEQSRKIVEKMDLDKNEKIDKEEFLKLIFNE